MNFIYIKCHKALGKVKEGETIRVHGTEDGTPLDAYWRKRLKDAKTDGCCEVVEKPKAKAHHKSKSK
jgi:hypothetical protein